MWLHDLFMNIDKPSVAHAALIVAIVAASGLALGSIKIKSFSLGIPGVMFTGILAGYLGLKITPETSDFVKDFGLVLFVYGVGVQVGPGFLATLRYNGLKMNIMACSIVILGLLTALGIAYLAGNSIPTAVGMFAGATTNAPAFGSANEAMKQLPQFSAQLTANGQTPSALSGPAFALAYPFGLLGVIVAMLLVKRIFKVDVKQEAELASQSGSSKKPTLQVMNIEVANPNLNGLPLSKIPGTDEADVVVSRIYQDAKLSIAKPETTVKTGDVLLAVGPRDQLDRFRLSVGQESKMDLRALPSNYATRQVLVTHAKVLGKTLEELDLVSRYNVTVTRLSRNEVELTPSPERIMKFGDRLRVVGDEIGIQQAAAELGDSIKALNIPRLTPIFVGIILGVILGMYPIRIWGIPLPVKLGLAAGPMIVAIILARIGRIGPLIWYMPHNASSLLRELGIVLFLVAVGINAGEPFVEALFKSSDGILWMLEGAAVTLVPLMIVGTIARKFFKMNYLHVCGLLAGSMTSPSLPFVYTMSSSEAPAVAFATVYPLTMILRVLLAQVAVLMFLR